MVLKMVRRRAAVKVEGTNMLAGLRMLEVRAVRCVARRSHYALWEGVWVAARRRTGNSL